MNYETKYNRLRAKAAKVIKELKKEIGSVGDRQKLISAAVRCLTELEDEVMNGT